MAHFQTTTPRVTKKRYWDGIFTLGKVEIFFFWSSLVDCQIVFAERNIWLNIVDRKRLSVDLSVRRCNMFTCHDGQIYEESTFVEGAVGDERHPEFVAAGNKLLIR